MAFSITKNSYEKFPIMIDFSSLFGLNESITGKTVTCEYSKTGTDVTSALIDSSSVSGSGVTIVIKNGETLEFNVAYVLTVEVTTNYSGVFKRQINIVISDDYQDSFDKESSEEFLIKVGFVNEIESGDSISSGTAICKDADGTDLSSSMIGDVVVNGTSLYIWVKDGEDHHFYTIDARVETSLGYKYSRTILMNVGENLDVLY
jgi:hypothetical protein